MEQGQKATVEDIPPLMRGTWPKENGAILCLPNGNSLVYLTKKLGIVKIDTKQLEKIYGFKLGCENTQ